MAVIKAFECIRPDEKVADRVAALPYDVYNREEALNEVEREPLSFLAIDRAETQFDSSVDTYADCVYDKARELLDSRIADGTFITDTDKAYYVYELTMNGRTQTGIAACASIDDYNNNIIKKHENTRADKEQDRINHVDRCSAQTGPIFLAYRADEVIRNEVAKAKETKSLYSFTSPDGNESSFETVVQQNPDYIFVMDRDSAISTAGAKTAKEIVENELVKTTDAYKNNHIIYLEHSNVWYTAEGGIQALDIMLTDLEKGLK